MPIAAFNVKRSTHTADSLAFELLPVTMYSSELLAFLIPPHVIAGPLFEKEDNNRNEERNHGCKCALEPPIERLKYGTVICLIVQVCVLILVVCQATSRKRASQLKVHLQKTQCGSTFKIRR